MRASWAPPPSSAPLDAPAALRPRWCSASRSRPACSRSPGARARRTCRRTWPASTSSSNRRRSRRSRSAEFDEAAAGDRGRPASRRLRGEWRWSARQCFPDHDHQSLVAAAHAAGVKALLGVGGDASVGAPAGFQGATTPANRALFVTNIVAAMAAGGYDGVDINWESIEFPRDVSPFQAFVADLRTAL